VKTWLALLICLAALLPAAARAGDEPDSCRAGEPRHGHPRSEPRGQRGARTEFFVNVGYSRDFESYRTSPPYYPHEDQSPWGGPALELGFRRWLGPRVALGLMGGYHSLGSYTIGGGSNPTHIVVFPMTSVVTYRIAPRGPVKPYARFGAGVYSVRTTQEISGDASELFYLSQKLRFGYHAGLGADFRVGDVGLDVDAAWHVVTVDDVPYNHLTLLAGLRFR